MKFNRIIIKNLASLKGTHIIDFDEMNNFNQSIFAITGDTGSGKSTILNAISLALFGQTYKKSLNQYDYITLGEYDGAVELTYTQGARKYVAKWECRVRKKNGEFLKTPKAQRTYFEELQEAKIAIEKSPEELIGLSFEQFCQTIILNQGDFSRFLTSSFTDRKSILEKLYKGDKLKHLNPFIRKKITHFAQKKEIIETKMESLTGTTLEIDISQKEEKELEVKVLKNSKKSLMKSKGFLVDLIKLIQDFKTNSSRLELEQNSIVSLTEDRNQAANRLSNAKEAFEKLQDEYKSQMPLFAKAKELQTALDKTVERKKRKTLELKQQKESFTLTTASLESIIKKSTGLKKDFKEIPRDVKEKLQEDSFIQSLEELQQNIDIQIKEYAAAEMSLTQKREHKNITVKKHEDSTKLMLSLEKSVREYQETQISEEKERLTKKRKIIFEEIISLKSFSESSKKITSQIKTLKLSGKELDKNLWDLKKSINHSSEQICLFDEAIILNQINQAKETLITKSLDESECQVCGSHDIEHLSHTHAPSQRIQDVSEKKENELQRLKDFEQNQLLAQERRVVCTREIQSLEKELNTTLKKYNLTSVLNLDKALKEHETGLKEIENELSIKELSIVSYEKEKGQLKLLQDQSRVLEKELHSQINELNKTQKKVQEIVETGSDTLSEYNSLSPIKSTKLSSTQTATQKIIENNRTLQSYKLSQEKEQNLSKQISRTNKQLEIVENELLLISKDQKESEKEILLITKGKSLPELLSSLEKRHKSSQLDLDKGHENLKKSDLKISSAQAKINTYKEQLKAIETLFNSTHINFTSMPPSTTLVTEDQLSKLVHTIKIDTHSLDLYMGMLKQCETYIEKNESLTLEMTKEITEINLISAQIKKRQKDIKSLNSELKDLIEVQAQWEKLYSLLGRDEFRNFVLSYVEKLLIAQTNKELRRLYDGRYQLKQYVKEAKTSPEFYIIDKYHGGQTRKVSTLSGGETFMVSLAMAFALAELTRGETQIDSFFIDEGFGTLDEDAIEDVLITLQEIELRGKQIGLISHVKAMTSRIPINISLSKSTIGNSSISIIYN